MAPGGSHGLAQVLVAHAHLASGLPDAGARGQDAEGPVKVNGFGPAPGLVGRDELATTRATLRW